MDQTASLSAESSIALWHGLDEAVLVEDANRIVVYANPKFAELFLGPAPATVMIGVDCGAAARRSAAAFIEESAWIEATERAVVDRQPRRAELWQLKSGGWLERDYVPRFDGDRFIGHAWFYRDVTEREGLRRHLDALQDELASLAQPTPSAYDSQARASARTIEGQADARPVTIAMVKIDNLDAVNSELGRAAGDELLDVIPRRLETVLPDAHVERTGGSVFTVVTTAAADDALSAVQDAVGTTASDHGRVALLSLISGAVSTADLPVDARSHLQHARVALREARRRGTDVVLDAAGIAEATHRDRLGLALPGAIRRGDLLMAYQPVMRLDDRVAIGLESLVRWNRPEGGVIAAGSFIPAAESLGLITSLDEWVIGQVIAESGRVAGAGTELVGINISGRTLNAPGRLMAFLEAALESHGVPAARIVLEITESAVATHTQRGLQALREVSDAGIGVAVDDFGVGSSSLSLLKDIPFDYVKLDKSFTRAIDDPRVQSLVRVATSMAADFGATVVAEGLEQEHQLEQILACGVTHGQGWLLGMPSPVAA